MVKKCRDCGKDFYADTVWKVRCLSCWQRMKIRQAKPDFQIPPKTAETFADHHVRIKDAELARLKVELAKLHFELATVQYTKQATMIPQDILSKLIRLTHPDRYGGITMANEVTAWLLGQRNIRKP